MNRIQRKDFLREIRKNKGRFFSLLFIVALGCAFYSGIRSSEPDMTASADRYYDETNFCDIRLVSTLGLSEDNLKAVSEIEGVLLCEGAKSVELFAECADDQPVMNVVSLGDEINQFSVQEGRLPEAENECFMDVRYMDMQGARLGDQVTLLNMDKEKPEELSEQTFTIVGYGTWAWYLNLTRGSASIGDGSVDAFMVLKPEVFTQDYYTSIFATVEGALEVNCYEDVYDDIVEAVTDRIKGIEEVQVGDRRDAIVSEAQEAIDEAKDKIADAKKELADAEKKLKDGEEEYSDGAKELADGKKKFEDGKAEYEDGFAALTDGKKKYQDGLKEYNSGKKTYEEKLAEWEKGSQALEEGKKELKASKKKLEEGQASYENGLKEYQANEKLLKEKEVELKSGEAELEKNEKSLTSQKKELEAQKESLESQRSGLKSQQSSLKAQKTELQSQKSDLQSQKKSLESQKSSLQNQKAALEAAIPENPKTEEEKAAAEHMQAQLSEVKAGLNQVNTGIDQVEAGLSQMNDAINQVDAGLSQVNDGIDQLDDGLEQVNGGLSKINAGLSQIEANKEKIASGKKELAAGKKSLKEAKAKLEAAKKELSDGKKAYEAGVEEVEANEKKLASGKTQLDEAKKTLDEGKKELDDAATEIAANEKKLADAKVTIDEKEAEIADAEKKLSDARKELDDGWKEYNEGKAEAEEKIADGEREIAEGEQDLKDLKDGEWYVLTRNEIQTSVEYGMDAERIGKIATVFPLIFFLVAALVSLTTMTRMIEEERMLIGTMKALGYSKTAILSKYLMYAFTATMAGGLLGVLGGSKVLPYVIMKAYGMLYTNVPYMLMPYQLGYCFTAIGMALLCTVGAAWAACNKELLSTPAALMRPPAPKNGKKIILERIPFIWSHLNFSLKATFRNLFRYKKRFIMTVLGIGGCMAILLVSYGLHDSIAAIVDNQYKKVWTYSAYCGLEENLEEAEKTALKDEIAQMVREYVADSEVNAESDALAETESESLSYTMLARNISLDVSANGVTKTSYLYVVESPDDMSGFLSLHDRVTKEEHELTDEGIIISEKLGRMLNVNPGDEMKLKISDSAYRSVTVTATSENYLSNYIYMTPALYKKIYREEVPFNECAIRYQADLSEEDENELAERILSMEGVNSVSLVRDLQETVDNMMNALNLVVWVLVIAAGLLVFVVSFNLNNINISERRRELASLKVLGFYDLEVAMYVYRENLFLTLFGILAGIFMGTWLHRYVITTLEVEMIMFGRDIRMGSYLYSSLLTILFSVMVNVMMYYKLKQIDMVESLKSVE